MTSSRYLKNNNYSQEILDFFGVDILGYPHFYPRRSLLLPLSTLATSHLVHFALKQEE